MTLPDMPTLPVSPLAVGAALIAVVAVGGMCAPLLTFGGATYALTRSEPRAIAELHDEIRKELTR